ncbi:ERV/ALR sulfhydryl oxidase domain-containing protein [Annulohypoxylon maeteangense]|uniref:ERV/ALR sulfhydryl oxidase domain-containing protein n=1 Tax=Annulohypoxylon maeteangense TaxID=1927788 RepID=UPI002007FF77|nr:ERV/ALR sulfhydryl oxidase domain-containing protein [Annulohypoxylon maeteangense]KAI0880347.1 ERV/ALR sulfhydryl oxidase domain-containing protein [Annulohypoxylon maeteangense]
MARHLSVIVILAIAGFLVLSFMTSFGDKAGPIRQVLPVKGVTERPPADPAPIAPIAPNVKPDTNLKTEVKEDVEADAKPDLKSDFAPLPGDILTGGAIAPKLENATLKAELGRSTWKFLHTMMARFPDKPTADDSLALKTFVQLFARLYPCGDCARHFQKLLAKYPPQVSSRNAAAAWACFMHNQVNERLKKPLFDCNNIGDFYDCGCGDDKKETTETIGELKLEKEGLTKGG